MDYEALRELFSSAVPFNQHLGLQVLHVGAARGEVLLPERPELSNHLGTQHAGALFSAGEAASGAAMAGAFADLLTDLTPVARGVDVRYLKPARGPVTARAALAEPAEGVRARLRADGKAEFDVEVSLRDAADVEVAQLRVRWHLRLRPAA